MTEKQAAINIARCPSAFRKSVSLSVLGEIVGSELLTRAVPLAVEAPVRVQVCPCGICGG
jgi:hypothetical protein